MSTKLKAKPAAAKEPKGAVTKKARIAAKPASAQAKCDDSGEKADANPRCTETTLADMTERYLRHMEDAGKSNGTIFSYRLELLTAMQ